MSYLNITSKLQATGFEGGGGLSGIEMEGRRSFRKTQLL